MTDLSLGAMRKRLDAWWERIDRRYVAHKDSVGAFWELDQLYRTFDPAEKMLADRIFAEWLSAADPGKQWDARAMIGRHRIRSAIPQLEAHIRELMASDDPMKRAFAEVARRTLAELIQLS